MNYEDHRRNYVLGGLRSAQLAASPVEQFARWQDQAIAAELKDPTAASLATVETDGRLWQRIVLLKQVSDGGFVFFTNYDSNKGRALASDSRASLLFPWNEIDRQVTVSGSVERVSAKDSDDYFAARPRASQIGAWTSDQSQSVADRSTLEEKYRAMEARFEGVQVTRPAHWGGYRLVPQAFEFWQGGEHRLHDRFRYDRDGDGWQVSRLQP